MIATTRYSRGLYFFDDDAFFRDCSTTSLLSSYFPFLKNDCILWHFHLGHPNFQYMKYNFPHLFSKVDLSSLFYDVCIRAKQPRVSIKGDERERTHLDTWKP